MWENIYIYKPLAMGEYAIIVLFVFLILYLAFQYLRIKRNKKRGPDDFIDSYGFLIPIVLILIIPCIDFTIDYFHGEKLIDYAEKCEADIIIEGEAEVRTDFRGFYLTIEGEDYYVFTGILPYEIPEDADKYKIYIKREYPFSVEREHYNDEIIRVDAWIDNKS